MMSTVETVDLISLVAHTWPEYPVFPFETPTGEPDDAANFWDTKFGHQLTAWHDILGAFSFEHCRAALAQLAVAAPEMPPNPLGRIYRQATQITN